MKREELIQLLQDLASRADPPLGWRGCYYEV